MALFKNKKNEYEEASKNLNKGGLASDRLIFQMLEDDDEEAAALVNQLKSGNPLVLNFEKLEPVAANKLLAFFAGACYALDGKSVSIGEKIYLFARKSEFIDGSLNDFIEEYGY